MAQVNQIIFRGSPGLWELVSGVLPEGVVLDVNTGELVGDPSEYGEFPCMFSLTNRCGTTTKEVVVISCSSPEILSDEIIFEYVPLDDDDDEPIEPGPGDDDDDDDDEPIEPGPDDDDDDDEPIEP